MSEITIKMPANFTVDDAVHFREAINNDMNKGAFHFMIDFSECQFIDSTGLGVIVSSYKKCLENGGELKLKSLNPNVKKVFELTRLTSVFEIH